MLKFKGLILGFIFRKKLHNVGPFLKKKLARFDMSYNA